MEEKIIALEKNLKEWINFSKDVNNRFISILEEISKQINKIEEDIALIKTKVDHLDGTTSKSFGKVENKLEELKTELKKINQVTGYEDQVRNQSSLGGHA